jgi:hypothetical protein
MFGIQKILMVAAIILGLLYVPRMFAKRPKRPQPALKIKFSGKIRMALAASVVYTAIVAWCLQPWIKDPVLFLYVGLGPILLSWLLYWVFLGFKKK